MTVFSGITNFGDNDNNGVEGVTENLGRTTPCHNGLFLDVANKIQQQWSGKEKYKIEIFTNYETEACPGLLLHDIYTNHTNTVRGKDKEQIHIHIDTEPCNIYIIDS